MKVPIAETVGKTIVCPQCGSVAIVEPAQLRMGNASHAGTTIATANQHVLVVCTRCVKKLYPKTERVELAQPCEEQPCPELP